MYTWFLWSWCIWALAIIPIVFPMSPRSGIEPTSNYKKKKKREWRDFHAGGKLWLKKHTTPVLVWRDIWQGLWVSQRMWRPCCRINLSPAININLLWYVRSALNGSINFRLRSERNYAHHLILHTALQHFACVLAYVCVYSPTAKAISSRYKCHTDSYQALGNVSLFGLKSDTRINFLLRRNIRGWSEKFSASTIDGNNIGKIFFPPKLVHLS